MIEKWNGEERRSVTCPLHEDYHENVQSLWRKVDNAATKDDIERICDLVGAKLDKWVFNTFIASVTILIVVACSLFGWVALESIDSTRNIAILQVNQERLLKHFEIPSIQDPDLAKAILERESTNGKGGKQ